MRGTWGILLMAALLAAAVGCSKQQTLRTGDGLGSGSGTATGGLNGTGPNGTGGSGDAITSETLRSEAGTRSANGTGGPGGTTGPDGRLAMAEAQAGVAATQEKASPFKDIRFDYDQHDIRDDARPELSAIATWLAKNSGVSLVIEGHCDARGTAEYNMALGEKRAESVRSYLANLGVNKARLITVSYGKEKPLVTGETEEAWAANRRAHFLLK